MYRILLADDEGIAIEALRFIIEKNFEDDCQIEAAKSGRAAIELVDSFRPDIVCMDIRMPGINGIEAIREIKSRNPGIIFIVISAYDKFDYAKEAVHLGVLEYVNKPVEQEKMVSLLKRAMVLVDEQRAQRSKDLLIKEKLEIVIPVIENGFIYAALFQDNYVEDIDNYKQLLGMSADYGFMTVLECGDNNGAGHVANPIGASVQVQPYYQQIRTMLKEYFPQSAVGAMMGNKIIMFVVGEDVTEEYVHRIALIDYARKMIRELRAEIGIDFRMGIGSLTPLSRIHDSYEEAIQSIRFAKGSVVHVKDLPIGCGYEADYPLETEKRLFERIANGDATGAVKEVHNFFDWMLANHGDMPDDIRLKVLEFVLWAEKKAYESGGMTYVFTSRHFYLSQVMNTEDLSELRVWMVDKVTEVCRNILCKKEESNVSIVEKAKDYILRHFSEEITLDDVSEEMNITPYYFSKLFKDEAGVNFSDYLREIRMERAKYLLTEGKLPMKEICVQIGCADPNYFSRMFKKYVGVTPTEYKEGKTSETI